jgi:hypothetical protein
MSLKRGWQGEQTVADRVAYSDAEMEAWAVGRPRADAAVGL